MVVGPIRVVDFKEIGRLSDSPEQCALVKPLESAHLVIMSSVLLGVCMPSRLVL